MDDTIRLLLVVLYEMYSRDNNDNKVSMLASVHSYERCDGALAFRAALYFMFAKEAVLSRQQQRTQSARRVKFFKPWTRYSILVAVE
jgi:hypothetical protein